MLKFVNCIILSACVLCYIQLVTASDVLPRAPECGTFTNDRSFDSNVTSSGSYPWTALLEFSKPDGTKSVNCAAVLISKRYVVAPAHCVSASNIPRTWTLSSVRLGEYDLLNTNELAVNIAVSEQIVHESYDPQSKNKLNDIALLRLESDVPLTDFVKPICLPRDSNRRGLNYENIVLEFAGWYRRTNEYSVKLRGQVTGVNDTDCYQRYAENFDVSLQNSQLCIKPKSGFDPCYVFSGTPIMSLDGIDQEAVWYLIGLVSFGPTPCGKENPLPDVVTRIDSFVDWIESKLNA